MHFCLADGIDLVAKIFLFFTQENTVIALLCIGFLGYDKKKVSKTLFLLLFSMILNAFLKSIWQIPLSPKIGTGFAFPSGHMQNSAVLWGWLSLEVNQKPFFAFSIFLLSGVAFGLLHFGYHTPVDILGALFFAIILLIAYPYLLKKSLIKKQLALAGFTLSLLALPMIYFISNRPSSIFIAESALVGFSLGILHKNALLPINTLALKVKSIILAIFGIIIIQLGFKYFSITPKELSLGCCYFLTALWVSVGVSKCIQSPK